MEINKYKAITHTNKCNEGEISIKLSFEDNNEIITVNNHKLFTLIYNTIIYLSETTML